MFHPSGWLMRRFGNRGLVLILFGLIWIILGWGALEQPNRALPDRPVPFWLLACFFIGCGAMGLIAGIFRRFDEQGWTAMMAPPAATVGLFTWWEIFGLYHGAIRGITIYTALSLALYFCARGLDRCPGCELMRMIATEEKDR